MGKGKKKPDLSKYTTEKLPSKSAEFLEKNPHLFEPQVTKAPIPPPLSKKKVEKLEKSAAAKVEKPKVVDAVPPVEPADVNAPIISLPRDAEDRLYATIQSWPFVAKGILAKKTQWELETVYETLMSTGFERSDVEAAMTVCGGDLTECFDWLSLNIPTIRLPKGWTDLSDSAVASIKDLEKQAPAIKQVTRPKPVQIKQRDIVMLDYNLGEENEEDEEPSQLETPKEASTSHPVTDVTSEGRNPGNEVEEINDLPVGDFSTDEKESEVTKATESYHEQDDHKSIATDSLLAALGDDAAFLKKQGNKDNKTSGSSLVNVLNEETTSSANDSLAAVLGDDLALLMHETNLSDAQDTGPLMSKEEADGKSSSGMEEDDTGMGGLFDEDQPSAKPVSLKSVERFSGVVPTQWTGQTPKALLSAHVKKRDWDEPKYPKTGKNPSAHVILSCGPTVLYEFKKDILFSSENIAREYIATWALFSVFAKDFPSLDIQLPPDFRALWREWSQAESKKLEELDLAKAKPRVDFVNKLVNSSIKAEAKALAVVDHSEAVVRNSGSSKKLLWRVPQLSQVFRAPNRIDTSQLPIYNIRDELVDYFTSDTEDFAVVCGETGSGKTTQVPKLMLETMVLAKSRVPRIAIAEPRRASATSVCKRVGEELACAELAGYQIRGESTVIQDKTCLLFCTTGILLRRAQDDALFMDLDAIIIDEIHERTMDADVLLVLVKKAAEQRRKAGLQPLKVIAMSATLDSEKFSEYFNRCRVMKSTGRTFPVQVHFLEDVIELTQYEHLKDYDLDIDLDDDYDGRKVKKSIELNPEKEYSKQTIRSLELMDESIVNHSLIEKAVLWALNNNTSQNGAVLVFLPGLKDIQQLEGRLGALKELQNDLILPLHSSQSTSEQMRKVFDIPKPPQRKIVLSTNIAETGVTIPDVTVVIDTCRANIVGYIERRGLVTLTERYISKANAEQRTGRAGRVQEGICLRLVTRSTYSKRFEANIAPEIRRVPLDQVCLSVLAQGLDPQEDFFPFTLDPPTQDAVKKALARLARLGATRVVSAMDSSGATGSHKQKTALTSLGRTLARLPVDPRIGKMIVIGSLMGISDTACALAACMATEKSLFMTTERKKTMASSDSDDLTELWAFRAWQATSRPSQYARIQGLHHIRLMETRIIYDQLRESVRTELGISPVRDTAKSWSQDARVQKALASIACEWAVFQPTKNRAEYRDFQVVYKCRDGSDVALAQRSVLFGTNRGALALGSDGPKRARVFAYSGRMKTKKDNITDMTMVTPMMCALFAGGSFKPEHRSRHFDVDGGWLPLRASPRLCAALSRMKRAFEGAVECLLDGGKSNSSQEEARARSAIQTAVQLVFDAE